ncbi:MAG: glycosyltransferase family 4 protein, partial [Cyanobacteria bacterium HKST-UBA06]|nr:glycosyltransferase family 4 protein [Cyanobacteria bacterium HKST-UBA06]
MKILLVTKHLTGGGAEAVVQATAACLTQAGHEVHVAWAGPFEHAAEWQTIAGLQSVTLHTAPSASPTSWPSWGSWGSWMGALGNLHHTLQQYRPGSAYQQQIRHFLDQTVARICPDLVHVHHWPGIAEGLGNLACPTLLTVHHAWPVCPADTLLMGGQTPCELACTHAPSDQVGQAAQVGTPSDQVGQACLTHRCLSNPLLRHTRVAAFRHMTVHRQLDAYNRVIAPSQALCRLLQQSGVVEASRIHHLANPMPPWLTPLMQQPAASPHTKAVKVPGPPDGYFLAVGHLARHKGFDYLLDVWQSLSGPERWPLKIAGSGPDYNLLNRRIKRHGLSPFVSLLG